MAKAKAKVKDIKQKEESVNSPIKTTNETATYKFGGGGLDYNVVVSEDGEEIPAHDQVIWNLLQANEVYRIQMAQLQEANRKAINLYESKIELLEIKLGEKN